MAKINYEYYSNEASSAPPAEINRETEARIARFRAEQLGRLALKKF